LYPRAWRQRYEEEFLALLDQSPVSWRIVIDVALGAGAERLRQVSRVVIGETAATSLSPGTTSLRCAVMAVVISATGWVTGRLLNSLVADAVPAGDAVSYRRSRSKPVPPADVPKHPSGLSQ
jgi:hypothetical protein